MSKDNRQEDAHPPQKRRRSAGHPAKRRWHAGFEQKTVPEPIFAAMMHVINRLALGAGPATEIEEDCERIYRNSSDAAQDTLSQLAREYMALPKALRARTAPPSLVRLDPATPLSYDFLQSVSEESVRLGGSPVTPVILDASLSDEDEITLLGNGFAVGMGDISITVGSHIQTVTEPIEISPSSVTAGTIRFQLPPGLRGEKNLIVRVVRHDEISLLVRDAIYNIYMDLLPKPPPAPPLPLPPKITKLDPEGSRPGESVLINGENFTPYIDLNGCRVHVEELDRETGFAVHILANGIEDKEGWRADVRSATQIRLRLGYNIPPGRYTIRVSDDTTKLTSDLASYKIIPWRFQVNFRNFQCTDESNEASSADEVVTAWAVSADNHVFLKSTHEYESVDKNDTINYRNEDRSVLTPDGVFYPIEHVLSVITRLYEWDDDAITRLSSEEASHKIAQALSSSGNSTAQGAAVVVILAGLLADALSSIGSGADPLGEQKLVWTAPELMMLTRNSEGRFEGELFFNNPDSEGSHIVRYEVLREF